MKVATFIALLFHCCGLIGILFGPYANLFIQATPLNMLLMALLLIWTQSGKNIAFFGFVALAAGIGFLAEWIGVNTGYLFGQYSYGTVLGTKWQGVPFLIGVIWFITIYCCGISVNTIFMRLSKLAPPGNKTSSPIMRGLSVMADGAMLATFFDWIIEPVAIKLGFWQWGGNGEIPFFNYISWYFVSLLLLAAFHWLPFGKNNKFAVHLLLVQILFFLILRTFL